MFELASDFALYMAIVAVVILIFLCLCVRISVYIENTCPHPFCTNRKEIKTRDILAKEMLFPGGEALPPILCPAHMAPPSDENITADIVCQPYIYRDVLNTGLTTTGQRLPMDIASMVAPIDINPSDAVVVKTEQVPRIKIKK